MAERKIYRVGDTAKSLVTVRDPGGKTSTFYKKWSQDMDDAIDRTRFLAQKVNSAPKSGNRIEQRYRGSVPVAILHDWLQRNGYRPDQYARNEDNARDKFMAWFLTNRDMTKFHAKTYQDGGAGVRRRSAS
jgi:hypothetical protein